MPSSFLYLEVIKQLVGIYCSVIAKASRIKDGVFEIQGRLKRQRRYLKIKSATGLIRRGEPGAAPQEFKSPSKQPRKLSGESVQH
jgi:hypothetical protein